MMDWQPSPRHWLSRLGNWRFLFLALIIALILVLALIPWRGTVRARAERYYVRDQVILTGSPDQIDAVIAAAREALKLTADERALQLVSRVPLDYLAQLPGRCAGLDRAAPSEMVIDQYQIGGRVPVDRAIRAMRQQAARLGADVAAEPNYLTGRPPVAVTGDPWTVGASPWTVGASPWTVGGSPAGGEVRAAANQAFADQWALGKAGVNLAVPTSKDDRLGEGVRVGVFDTSPFPVTVSRVELAMSPRLELTLVHPMPGGRLTPDAIAPDVRDHGLFAAGLVHAVAPASEIQLIRVLDDTGQGDMQTLNRALSNFIADVMGSGSDLNGAVINLSLGIHTPPDAGVLDLPEEVASLKTVLAAARCAGIPVVAASGNDSARAPRPLAMQIPAAWEEALGVAASNDRRELACFSNEGQVLAPGGDGGPKPPACEGMLDTCTGDCPYALVGLSLGSVTGYSYWNGTSFAAPLVSGTAARILSGMLGSGAAPSGDALVQQVYDRILAGAPDRVVDLTEVLTP